MEPFVDRLPEDIDVLARRLLEEACRRHLTLATAESCTGGLIGAVLTDVEGTSHAFERGFIVYSDEAKASLLGIPRKSIDAEGAVSQPIALAMAKCPPKACSPNAADPSAARPMSILSHCGTSCSRGKRNCWRRQRPAAAPRKAQCGASDRGLNAKGGHAGGLPPRIG